MTSSSNRSFHEEHEPFGNGEMGPNSQSDQVYRAYHGGPPEDTLTRPSSNGSQVGPDGDYDDFRDDISNLSSLRISIQEPELKDIESDSDDSPNTRDQLRALRESNERLRKEHVDRCKELLKKKRKRNN